MSARRAERKASPLLEITPVVRASGLRCPLHREGEARPDVTGCRTLRFRLHS